MGRLQNYRMPYRTSYKTVLSQQRPSWMNLNVLQDYLMFWKKIS